MSFLKRIFGRSRWEQVADDPDGMVPVWDTVPHPSPVPIPTDPSAPPRFQPGLPPVPVSSPPAPPPTFQPAAVPITPAPPPTFQPAAVPITRAPPPTFQPAVSPVPRASARVSFSRPPAATQEIILDTVAPDDQNMPEEFRGCRVVERTLPDGKVEVLYKGPDGFTVNEAQADILISAHREELRALRPKPAQPRPSLGYALPPAARPAAVEPRLVAKPKLDLGSPTADIPLLGDETIDELGTGMDLPPELRGARFVRSGGQFFYITREGQRHSKDMAEGMMERWDRDQVSRHVVTPVAAPYEPPPRQAPAPVALVPPAGAASAPFATPAPRIPWSEVVTIPDGRPPSGPAPTLAGALAELVLPDDSGAVPGAEEPVPAATAREVADGLLVDAVEASGLSPQDATRETVLDGDAVVQARRAAERLRQLLLNDEDAAYEIDVPVQRLQQACQSEIDRRRTKHRLENLLTLSAEARDTLADVWRTSSNRVLRDATKDLSSDMLVVGVFNPMTLPDIDVAEFISLARLRGSERRRDIVTGEIARRIREEIPGALHQYILTRAFVDHVGDAAGVTSDPPETVLQNVLFQRLEQALAEVVGESMKRHGVWFPDLVERLVNRLQPVVRQLLKK